MKITNKKDQFELGEIVKAVVAVLGSLSAVLLAMAEVLKQWPK